CTSSFEAETPRIMYRWLLIVLCQFFDITYLIKYYSVQSYLFFFRNKACLANYAFLFGKMTNLSELDTSVKMLEVGGCLRCDVFQG
ncbi:MAG: hypothetical protein IJ467_02015, partial [Bacteroidaceae bacterium]|nr:hypothetical protein [Bacteroidaceae bacterium]